MESEEFKELNRKLLDAGAVSSKVNVLKGVHSKLSNPIDIFINTKISALPYEDILLEYAPKLKGIELESVIRVMTEKGFSKASSFLISLFENKDIDRHTLWAAGNALSVINDKKTYNEILNICKNVNLGISRQMLVGVLSKMKSDEAYNTLIQLLNDKEIRGHVIESLGIFGRAEAISNIEKLEVEKGKYEYRAKITALIKLKKKLLAK